MNKKDLKLVNVKKKLNNKCIDLLEQNYELSNKLEQSFEKYKELEGFDQLMKNFENDKKLILRMLYEDDLITLKRVKSSNLNYYIAILNILDNSKNCTAIFKAFYLGEKKIFVDVVTDGGLTWIKAIGRNSKSVKHNIDGNVENGQKSFIVQATEMAQLAKDNSLFYQIPSVVFYFLNKIDKAEIDILEETGVTVINSEVKRLNGFSKSININDIINVNLDVTCMLAYVSSLTNGNTANTNYKFTKDHLNKQLEAEKRQPLKPILDKFFEGKHLICCRTAYNDFINIISTIGGPTENKRAKELLNRITIYADNSLAYTTTTTVVELSSYVHLPYNLSNERKMKQRSKVIFYFGKQMKAVTVTANTGFLRASSQRGIQFMTFIHEPRSLTEKSQLEDVLYE